MDGWVHVNRVWSVKRTVRESVEVMIQRNKETEQKQTRNVRRKDGRMVACWPVGRCEVDNEIESEVG